MAFIRILTSVYRIKFERQIPPKFSPFPRLSRNRNFILWFLSNIGNWIFHLLMWNGIYWLITRSNKNKKCIFPNYFQQSKFGWHSWARCAKLGGDKLTNLLRASKFWQDIIRLTPTFTRYSYLINYKYRQHAGRWTFRINMNIIFINVLF